MREINNFHDIYKIDDSHHKPRRSGKVASYTQAVLDTATEALEIAQLNIDRRRISQKKKPYNLKRWLAAVVCAAVLLAVGLSCGVWLFKGETVSTKTLPNDSAASNDSDLVTEYGVIGKEIVDDYYRIYTDKDFVMYCAVPKDYLVGESIGGGNRLALRSPDGSAMMYIGIVKNTLKLKPAEIARQYIIQLGGENPYYAVGDSWYAVSNRTEDNAYYRKCFVSDEFIYWFEFNVSNETTEPAAQYIEYIEAHFSLNKLQ